MAIHYPPIFINSYLADKIPSSLPNRFSSTLRFFPTSPTTIDDLTQNFPDASSDVFAVYDRMFKLRRKPFPHIKSEQLLYYFYKTAGDPEALIETTQLVLDLLDNEDESAQDLNAWIEAKQKSADPIRDPRGEIMPCVFFHKIKVFQLEEARDIVDFGTARTFAGNKIIIDYEWHKS